MSGADGVVLLLSGALAGVLGTAGGITSLVSYPALLAVGLPPVQATVANLVAVVACWPASAIASGRELRGRTRALLPGLIGCAVGAGVGTLLLLTTTPEAFAAVVPFLVLLGSLALLAQPRLTRWSSRRPVPGWVRVLVLAAVSVYSGYFGAGAGVMLLAASLVLLDARYPRANAFKNMFVGAGALCSAVILAAVADVPWGAVVPLAVGLFGGSLLGPAAARNLPERVVRWAVALLGLGLAGQLGWSAFGPG